MKVRIFISYSRKDAEIARLLDSSLITSGVETFLDERDILVGESFPDRIFEGIGSAHHLLYIISSSSIESKWVREELSIAKVKEKEEEGFKILPVLIEDVLLPTSVRHIQYADFRQWRDRDSYRLSFLTLLRSIGVQPRFIGGYDIKWYSRHGGLVRGIHSALQRIYGEIEGGFAASYVVIEGSRPGFRLAVKWALEEDDAPGLLCQLKEALADSEVASSARLSALRTQVDNTHEFWVTDLLPGRKLDDRSKVRKFEDGLGSVCAMLEEFRGEIELVLLSGVKFE